MFVVLNVKLERAFVKTKYLTKNCAEISLFYENLTFYYFLDMKTSITKVNL